MAFLPTVPFDDRGFAYGDGVFETLLLRNGQPVLWDFHRARLWRGCEVLGITPPSDQSLEATWQAAAPSSAETGQSAWLEVLKIVVTRGSGGRGYASPAEPVTRLLSQRSPFSPAPARWQQGVSVCLCRMRLGQQPALAGIKHLNRLENVMARREWQRDDIAEGLLADQQGNVIEATSMNLFWQQDGKLWTPDLQQCGVAGTLRAALLKEQWVQVGSLSINDLTAVEHLWVGNSVQGVWPVTALVSAEGEVQHRLPIAADDPLQPVAHSLLGYQT
ncbi:aminodeoxychorismate lyase [Halomonas sp. LS-001]